jgi:hypothetical protein
MELNDELIYEDAEQERQARSQKIKYIKSPASDSYLAITQERDDGEVETHRLQCLSQINTNRTYLS